LERDFLFNFSISFRKEGFMKRFLGIFLSLLLVVCLAGTTHAKKFRIKWGATSVRSGLYANTVAIGGIINKAYPGEIQVTVVETGGFVENLVRIQKKSVLFGPASAAAAYAAYKGIIDFKGRTSPDLRALWGGYVTPIHIVTSKKSGVTSLEGLNGLPYAMNPGTTSGRVIELFYDALGIKPKYKMMGISASVDAMKSGVVKGWFKAGFKDAAILDLEATMDINIMPISKEMIDRMNEKYPGHGLMLKLPPGLFKTINNGQLSFAYVISDFVHRSVPEDVVYKIVKAVWENREELVRPLSTLKEGRFADMYDMAIDYDLGVPFHPGAAKFYQEVLKVSIPDKLLPPEMK
jgi:TRAP transporter TAXI family solute receptor